MVLILDLQLVNACSNSCWFCPSYNKEHKDRVEYINMDKLIEFINYGIDNKYVSENVELNVYRYHDPLLNIDNSIEFIKKMKERYKNARVTSIVPSNNLLNMNMSKVKEFFNVLDDIKINIYREMFKSSEFDSHVKKVVNYMLTMYKTKKFNIQRDGSEMRHVNIMDNNDKRKIRITVDQEANLKAYNILKSRGGSIEELIDSNYIRDYNCDATKLHFGVDSNGNVMPCCETYSRVDSHKCLIIGNIYTDSFENIYQTIKTKEGYLKGPCEHCLFTGEWLFGNLNKEVNK